MKRRLAKWTGAVFVLAVLLFLVFGRPGPQRVTFGPHKADVKFVPFEDADRNPWLDISVPIVGRIVYPNIEKIPLAANDDRRFVSGYIVVEKQGAAWTSPDRFEVGGALVEDDKTYLRVEYPSSKEDAAKPKVLRIENVEDILVRRAFDASKPAARYGEAITKVGEVTISARLGAVDDAGPMVIFKVDATPSIGTVHLRTKFCDERLTGPWPARIRVLAKPEPDGAFILDGTVAHGPGAEPSGAETSFKLAMKL